MAKNAYPILFAGFFLFGMFSFLFADDPNKKDQETSKEINIAWIGPITGPANSLGIDNLKAIKLSLAQYAAHKNSNDPNLHLIVFDDEYDPKKAVEAYRNIIATYKPTVVFMSTYSAVKEIGSSPLANASIIIDPVDNDLNLSNLNHNLFFIAKETEGLAAIVANEIIAQNRKKVIIFFFNSDDFMKILAKTTELILRNAGVVVKMNPYKAGTTRFVEELLEADSQQADAYVFYGYTESGYGMKQARDLGIIAPFYSVSIITDPFFQENAKGAEEGTIFAHFTQLNGNQTKAVKFLKDFVEKYHQPPEIEWVALQAYDASNILIKTLKEVVKQGGNLIDNVRDNLLRIADYEGVSGNISIQANGASRGIFPSLYIFKNGKIVPFTENEKK